LLIADRYAVVRAGLRRTFEASPDLVVDVEAASGAEALSAVEREVHCLITDLDLPDRDGLELLRAFADRRPSLPVVVFASSDDDELALRCLRAGAAAFVGKSDPLAKLIEAVRTVVGGRKYLTASLAARLAAHLGSPVSPAPHLALSQREYQVMHGMVRGESLTEIGRKLCLSPKTVSTYRARLLNKLDLKNNAELIRYALTQRGKLQTQPRR